MFGFNYVLRILIREQIYTNLNNGLPAYRFATSGLQTLVDQNFVAQEMLEEIPVVPNPYYGYSSYEKYSNR
ncbi:MAG: hypothetical protein IPO32_19440 [Crocinitomicaceae bacterium]|nr:hypothetical protein [Crocinitomicaceae bacterium]